MRICLVSLDFPPFRSSGLTIYAENLARGLAKWGHQVTVIAGNRSHSKQFRDASAPPGIRVLRVPVGPFEWLSVGWQAARYLRYHAGSFDIIHFADVHFAYAWHGQFVASAFQSFRQRLTAHHGRPYHSGRFDYVFRKIYYTLAKRWMEQPSAWRARFLFMSSQATQREFIEHYGIPANRTSVIYPGIDLEPFQRLPDRKTARARVGLPHDVPVLLYIGFSTPRKGVEYLGHALSKLNRHVLLIMVGRWEKAYLNRFLRIIEDLQSSVRLVGYVSDEEKITYLAAADIFVFPTLLEGFGFPIVEAMAAGLPVITTSAGSAGEVAGNAGLIVPPGDSAALADALNCLLMDPALADRLRSAGQARAREHFDLWLMIKKIDRAYKSLFN